MDLQDEEALLEIVQRQGVVYKRVDQWVYWLRVEAGRRDKDKDKDMNKDKEQDTAHHAQDASQPILFLFTLYNTVIKIASMVLSIGCFSFLSARNVKRQQHGPTGTPPDASATADSSRNASLDTTTQELTELHERFALSSTASDSTSALSVIQEEHDSTKPPPLQNTSTGTATSTLAGSRQVSSSAATSTTPVRDVANMPYMVGASELFESREWFERSETSFPSSVSTDILLRQGRQSSLTTGQESRLSLETVAADMARVDTMEPAASSSDVQLHVFESGSDSLLG